jgi:RNase P/RNase MRP subunit POP5
MNPLYTLIARAMLSVLFIAGYGWIVVAALQAGDFSPAVKEVLIFLFGALTTSVVTVVNYWFSTSQGSADKTLAITRLTETRE